MPKPSIHLLELTDASILEQLQLEEALLRSDDRNWCVINQNSAPAIVLGISGQADLLINQKLIQTKPVPMIRRFSGGGTVFVDENTNFVTLICNSDQLKVPCFPDRVLKWSEIFYQPVFENINFRLIENDYVIDNRKFGGNAQYMRKNRWLHHTSLLWDYHSQNMDYLLMPQKTPKYREKREHGEFLCRLCHYFSSRNELKGKILKTLHNHFEVKKVEKHHCFDILQRPHRKATTVI